MPCRHACGVVLMAMVGTPLAAHTPSRCAPHIADQRAAWGAIAPPRMQPPAADGATVLHWPTATLGTWVVEVVGPRETSLHRVVDGEVTGVTWSTDCVPSTVDTPRLGSAGGRFTDADLRRLVAHHPRGLLYVWSPHMPLSVDGVRVARIVAERRGLPVTILLDPSANTGLARSVIARHGWPADSAIVADSTELRFRDVLVHAPTIQAYARGRLVGSAFPGYHTVDEYSAYLDRTFLGVP